jgi:nitroreductase
MGLSRLRPDPVDRHLIERMLEAANWAPSNEDTEPWRFTVFSEDGRENLADLFAAAMDEDAGESASSGARDGARKRAFAAPIWISIGMTPALKEDGSLLMSEDEELMAVACAVQNLHIMAGALGLAGMWHSKGTSVHSAVARGLGLEPPSRLLGFFMCGWPATEWLTSTRRPLSEKVRWVEEGK